MIQIETLDISGYQPAMIGMRNPMNSWDKNDSGAYDIGENDLKLAKKLALQGPVHAKYRRMIIVWANITAPLYWWKEFDTYKVGTVANSCSTMHKIAAKEFTIEDFSTDQLCYNVFDISGFIDVFGDGKEMMAPIRTIEMTIEMLNAMRKQYLETKDKRYWWQMIQLLPSSYNQKRTVMLSYENLAHIYPDRKDHKLDEWVRFCEWIETLPYAKDIIFPKRVIGYQKIVGWDEPSPITMSPPTDNLDTSYKNLEGLYLNLDKAIAAMYNDVMNKIAEEEKNEK